MYNRIRELRKEKGLTMKQLGSVLGLAESTISQYETGKRDPDISTLSLIAVYFNVTIEYLLGRSEVRMSPFFEGAGDTSQDIESFDTPSDFEKAWAERTGIPHNIDPTKAIPLVSAKELMLRSFEQLNPEGQFVAAERVLELTEIPKYQKDKPPQE